MFRQLSAVAYLTLKTLRKDTLRAYLEVMSHSAYRTRADGPDGESCETPMVKWRIRWTEESMLIYDKLDLVQNVYHHLTHRSSGRPKQTREQAWKELDYVGQTRLSIKADTLWSGIVDFTCGASFFSRQTYRSYPEVFVSQYRKKE
ncbi:hypothetical protein RRG08_046843 [Elysia crispata]|uniref:Uncharacterized protein n=1 Tax=Elysia crispata TaxID=231223 RepID=A0AAE1DK18_9GAST|nr:hypothetical protein RRG08_046843 [Elysia crispata]